MISNLKFLQELEDELLIDTGVHCAYGKYCSQLTLEELFTTDSVYMAACHSACGFRNRNDTFAFMSSPWIHSMELAERVVSGKFKPEYYRTREITERGKKRTIKPPKFESKVVQKVLCDYLLRPLLEPKMVNTCYASVRGRGTEKAYQDVLDAINKHGHPGSIIVMTDFSGYFASIDTGILEKAIGRYLADKRVLSLLMMFADADGGLSLGNETSQVPASWYPSTIDHYIKDALGNPDYFRFMDDILVHTDGEPEAEFVLQCIITLAEEQGLLVKPEKIKLVKYGQSFTFCKERFIFNRKKGYYYRLMNPKITQNEIRKIKSFGRKVSAGEMPKERARVQVRGSLGMIGSRTNTKKSVERIRVKYAECMGEAAPVIRKKIKPDKKKGKKTRVKLHPGRNEGRHIGNGKRNNISDGGSDIQPKKIDFHTGKTIV